MINYHWSVGNTQYELSSAGPTMVQVTATNPNDPRPREFFFPKKLLNLYAEGRAAQAFRKLFESEEV